MRTTEKNMMYMYLYEEEEVEVSQAGGRNRRQAKRIQSTSELENSEPGMGFDEKYPTPFPHKKIIELLLTIKVPPFHQLAPASLATRPLGNARSHRLTRSKRTTRSPVKQIQT